MSTEDKPKPEAIVVDVPRGDSKPKKGLVKRLSKTKDAHTEEELKAEQEAATKRKLEEQAKSVMSTKKVTPDSEQAKAAKVQCEEDADGKKAFKTDGKTKKIVGDVIDVDVAKTNKKAPKGLVKRLSKEKAAPHTKEELDKEHEEVAARKAKLLTENNVMKTDLNAAKERAETDGAKANKAKAAKDSEGQKAFEASDKTKEGAADKKARYCVISFGKAHGYMTTECPMGEDPLAFWKNHKKRQASIMYKSDDNAATWNKYKSKGLLGQSGIQKKKDELLPKSGGKKSAGDGLVKADLKKLQLVFKDFCGLTPNPNTKKMSSAKFEKFCKNSGLVDKKKGFTSNDIALTFGSVKTKGKNFIDYKQFQNALRKVGSKKYNCGTQEAYGKVVKIAMNASPKATGATKSQKQKGKLGEGTGSVKSGKGEEVNLDLSSDDKKALKVTFEAFSKLGGTSDGTTMNVSQFSKFCKDAGLGDEVGAGIAFKGAAGSGKKTIKFAKFPLAISKMADKADGAFASAIKKATGTKPNVTGTSTDNVGNLDTSCGVYGSGGGSNKDASQDLSALANRGVAVDARGVPISQEQSAGRKLSAKKKKRSKNQLYSLER